ncbi:MAG: carboxylesterase family protein [Flavobacteriales bacterium]|nr:carboxylesterase family protein [Flavobacteriales bacterium]MCB9168140.1 carboxylesterase family protein [Flavobacteriales bacterium]MCB9194295.1 carboxylesterase family protein [Flavobacteriales bacterium]
MITAPRRQALVGYMLLALGLSAQDCSIPFTTPLYATTQALNLLYGSTTRYDGGTEELRLNLFKPVGDGQVQRPLVVLVHGGGFWDGDRSDLNALCAEFASMGWAAATVSYRLDFYGTWLLGPPWTYDEAEVIRAAYRAQQDVRGAVRFLKARHLQDSTSTANVVLMGFSAGAIACLHAGYVDDPSEKPAACNAIGDVVHLFTHYARPDLGPIEGTLNLNGWNDEALAVASCYGGIIDTSFISAPLEPALYTYHQTGDPVVGCGYQQGLWGMPLGVSSGYPWLYGSCAIDPRVQHLDPPSGRYLFHPYNGGTHGVHDEPLIYGEARQFLRELFCSYAGLQVSARVFLEGPYDADTGLMRDDLRTQGFLPLDDPYPALGYVHADAGSNGPVATGVLAVTGNDAIVDRVVLELRDATDPAVVVGSRSVLLQRDGDIVDLDGVSPVTFTLPPGDYHVAVRHRNHLGCMTVGIRTLSATPTLVDLTDPGTLTYGTEARISSGGIHPAEMLWAGDVTFNSDVTYTGASNDRDPILVAIGGAVPTATVAGYFQEDVDMDGLVKYAGTANDRDPILVNIGGTIPTASRSEQLP